MGYALFKRLFDLGVALVLFISLSPLILVVAIVIRVKMGAPVLFRQMRPGLNGEPFAVLKFRTMLNATDSSGQPLPDAARLTTLGKWLRRLSLDELSLIHISPWFIQLRQRPGCWRCVRPIFAALPFVCMCSRGRSGRPKQGCRDIS